MIVRWNGLICSVLVSVALGFLGNYWDYKYYAWESLI